MAKYHGRNIHIYIDGYTMAGFTNTVNVEQTADIVDVSAFGDSKKNYVVGLFDSQVTHDGFFEDTPNSGGHAVLSNRIGSAVQFMLTIGTVQGAYGFAGSAELENMYSITSAINDAIKYKSKLVNGGTQGIDNTITLQARQQRSGTGVSWDSGTATNNGARIYLQNFGSYNASTPGNASGSVRVLAGSVAGGTTTTLVDFGAVGTAPSAAGSAISGTVPEFILVDCYSGTPQVAVAIARL